LVYLRTDLTLFAFLTGYVLQLTHSHMTIDYKKPDGVDTRYNHDSSFLIDISPTSSLILTAVFPPAVLAPSSSLGTGPRLLVCTLVVRPDCFLRRITPDCSFLLCTGRLFESRVFCVLGVWVTRESGIFETAEGPCSPSHFDPW